MFAHVRECEKQLKIVCEGECELESEYMCVCVCVCVFVCVCVCKRANPKGPEILERSLPSSSLVLQPKKKRFNGMLS